MSESWRHVGVDWSSGNWVAVGYDEYGDAGTRVFTSVEDLWGRLGDEAERVVVDVPIGLCGSSDTDEELSRECDDVARKVVGPRYRSVFTPPCREAVELANDGSDYAEVNEKNKEITKKGLSMQAVGIADGIKDVDDLMENDGAPGVILEGHPEVCFRAFADQELEYSKKTAAGVHERLAALEGCSDYDEGSWRNLAADLEGETGVGLDDLLDAIALALTARAPDDELHRLPNDDPPTDEEDLPMQMVYRKDEPFGLE